MQGKTVVTDALNALPVNELAARDQYFTHSRMLADGAWPGPQSASRTRWRTKPYMPTR